MTLKQSLGRARAALAAAGIEDAPLEAEVLLRHALGVDRVHLYLHLDSELSAAHEATFRHLVERRLSGEPTAYITGHREFFGLDFQVDPRVLIPRPETELLVETATRLALARNVSSIAEIGTGCGAIAITLAMKLPAVRIYATDISAAALEVARCNSQSHDVADRVCFLCGDMLDPLPGPVDLIVANLPYVSAVELARTGLAGFEPRLALDGGGDGLDKIRQLCRGASGRLNQSGALILEIGQGQAQPVVALLRSLFNAARIEVFRDPGGIERVISTDCLVSTPALDRGNPYC